MNKQELLQIAKPILFNTEMVKAILEGRKSCTRRVVNPHYRDDESGFQVITNAYTGEFIRIEKVDEDECGIFSDGTERYVNPPYKVGDFLYVRETWAKVDNEIVYRASNEIPEAWHLTAWKPSIHMPKEAARIFLRVTDVYVEKLHDITSKKAIKEGFEDAEDFGKTFFSLYPQADGDTWAWVIEFERVTDYETVL